MKLSKEIFPDGYIPELLAACQKAAIQLSIRSGIEVKAIIKPVDGPYDPWATYDSNTPLEIVFQALDNYYNTLKEVRKALKLKAFL